jgi:uncharacterized membrane protein
VNLAADRVAANALDRGRARSEESLTDPRSVIMITHSVEINRPPEDVFAYLDALERHGEWQDQIVSAKIVTEGPVGVGTRCEEVRKVGGREQKMSYEITEHDPPRRSSFKGTDGPVRPVGVVTIEPTGDGASRVTIEFDLVGYGLGKLFAPLARMQARKTIAGDQEKLKAQLESS